MFMIIILEGGGGWGGVMREEVVVVVVGGWGAHGREFRGEREMTESKRERVRERSQSDI